MDCSKLSRKSCVGGERSFSNTGSSHEDELRSLYYPQNTAALMRRNTTNYAPCQDIDGQMDKHLTTPETQAAIRIAANRPGVLKGTLPYVQHNSQPSHPPNSQPEASVPSTAGQFGPLRPEMVQDPRFSCDASSSFQPRAPHTLDSAKKSSGVTRYFKNIRPFSGRIENSHPISVHIRDYQICASQLGFTQVDKARFLINS